MMYGKSLNSNVTDVKYYRVTSLPVKGKDGDIYFVTNGIGDNLDQYVADKNGSLRYVGRVAGTDVPTVSAGTASMLLGSIVFSNSNNVSFGLSNSVITASIPIASFGMSNLGNTSGTSGLASNNLILAGGNNITLSQQTGIGGNTIYIQGDSGFSQSSLLQQSSLMTDYLGTNYTSHTHSQYQSTGNYLTTAMASNAGSNFVNTSQSSLFQQTADNSLSLGTSYTTHTHSQYVNTSVTSNYQLTSQMSNYQLTADNSLSLGTDYTTHTHSQYLTTQTVQPIAASGSNGSFNFSTLSFGNSNGLSFYTTNGSIVGSYTAAGGADGVNILAAGTQTANTTGTVKFENSNGITFGMSNNSQITASYTVPSVTEFLNTSASSLFQLTADNSLSLGTGYTTHTHSQYINTSQSTLFRHTSADSQLQFTSQMSDYQTTGNYLTTQSGQAYSAANGSNTFQTLSIVDSNGVSFSTGTQGLYATVRTDYQSSGNYLTTAMQSDAGSRFVNTSAGLNLTNISATLGSNSLSFSVAAQSVQPVAISASNGSFLFSTLNLVETNGVTWATSTDGIRASVQTNYQSTGNYLTTAMASNRGSDFVQANAVFNGTNASGTIASGNISVSVAAPVVLTSWSVSDNATSGTVGRLAFTNLNGVTLSLSSGTGGLHTIVGSHNALTSQSNQAFSAGAASSTFQTLSYQDSNGISFSNNAGAIRLTHALQFTSNTSGITSNAFNTSGSSNFVLTANSSLLQHTSATSAITSNALNTSVSRVINLIAATNNTGGGTASLSSNISFSNVNGATFYTSAGNAIALSYTVPTVPTAYVSSVNGSSGAISLNAGSSLSASTNGSSITFGLASNITTALQSAGNYLTTAALSSQTLAFSLSGNSATTNSSQILNGGYALAGGNGVTLQQSNNTISFSVATNYQSQGAYLTTAMASNRGSDFVQATAGFNGTNASGTIASNAISISVAAQSVQTQNLHNVTLSGNTSGVMAQISSGTWTLAGGNNITLSQNGNAITISGANVGGAQTAISGIIASDATYTSGTVSFRDGNAISFASGTGQGISISHSLQQLSNTSAITSNAFNTSGSSNFVLTANSSLLQHTSATSAITSNALNTSASRVINLVAATNNTGGGTASLSSDVSFSNANGISFYTSAGNAIVASYNSTQFQTTGNYLTTAAQSTQTNAFSLGGNTGTTNSSVMSAGGYVIAGGSGVTLSQSNNSLSWHVATTWAASNHSHGNPTLALTNLTGTTASASNGLTLSLSGNAAQTNQSAIRGFGVSNTGATAGNTGISTGIDWVLAGSNLITLSQSTAGGGPNTVWIQHPTWLTTARASNDAIGLNTAQSNVTWTANSAGLSLDGRGYAGTGTSATNASVTLNSNGLAISVAAPAAGVGIAAGTRTATTAGNLLFDNANGVTFGLNGVGGSIMTASHNGLTTARASNDAIGLNTAQTNVTWTVNSSGLSINAGGYAGTNTATTGGISVTLNTSGISINAPAFLTTAAQSSASNVSGIIAATNSTGGGTATLSGNISFSNTHNFTFFTSAGNAVVASYNNTNLAGSGFSSAGNNIGLSGTLNSAGLSLSATVPSQSNQNISLYALGNTTQNSSTLLNASNLSFNALGNISAGYSNGSIQLSVAGGGVTPVASASNGSFSFTTLGFSNANNVTFGTSAGGIITASVAAPGAAAENNWVNLLGANTAGNTTASGSTIGYSGINLTLSGTNGSIVNISAPGTSSLSGTGQVSLSVNGSTISIGVPDALTISRYNEFKESPMVAGNIGQASLHIQPWLIPNLHMDRVVIHKIFSNATNSSGSFTVSDWVGIYTKNVSTLSLLYSVSNLTNFSGSGTVGSYLSYGGGIKAITMGLTQTLTEGMYWIGVINRTTTGGVAGHTLNQALNSNVNTSYLGLMGVATNATNQLSLGFGVYTVSTSGMPASIAFTQINGNSSVFLRPPSIYFVSGTI